MRSGRSASRSFCLRRGVGREAAQRHRRRAANGGLRILHQSEEFRQQGGAVLRAELAHHERHRDANVDARVGERGPAAGRHIVIDAHGAHDDRQRLHERGADCRRGSGINVAHFVGKVAQRFAAGGQRLQGLVAHRVGGIEQRIGDDRNIRFHRLRAERAERRDGGGPHGGVGIFRVLGDERELLERRFAGFAEHPQRRGLDLGRSGANLFHDGGDGCFDSRLCSCRPPR